MPGSDPAAQFLDVPGARLYYERQGDGPLLPSSAAAALSKQAEPNRCLDLLTSRCATRRQFHSCWRRN